MVSKWLNGTVESSRILVLFLEAADKILFLKHFFFFLPVLEITLYYQTEELMFCKLVFCMCLFSTDRRVPRGSLKVMPIFKREYSILWPKKAQTSARIVKGGRVGFWKPTATTQFYPMVTLAPK